MHSIPLYHILVDHNLQKFIKQQYIYKQTQIKPNKQLLSLYLSIMPKTFSQSEEVSQLTLNMILQNGNKLLKEHKLINNNLFAYSAHKGINLNQQLTRQTGYNEKSALQTNRQENIPKTSVKADNFSYRSVRNVKSMKVSPQDKITNYSPRKSRVRDSVLSGCGSIRKKQTARDSIDTNKFIDISHLMNPNKVTSRKITSRQIQQQKTEKYLRTQLIQKQNQAKEQSKEQQAKQNQARQKQRKKKQYFMKQMLRNKNSKDQQTKFTTDQEGNIIFYDAQDNLKKTMKKKYPPSAINFSLEEQNEPEVQNTDYIRIKQRAAKGQAFASAVLKTMNVSRISLNMGGTANIDQITYMKRNDLFNNNHTRQVTTIPFLVVTEGTSYKQTNTNLSVSKKNSQRTYHSEAKSKFKTHYQTKRESYDNASMNIEGLQKDELENIGNGFRNNKKRSQSSRTYRPKSCIPQSRINTGRSAGRITSFNRQLVTSMIQ